MNYFERSKDELLAELEVLKGTYGSYLTRHLSLDLSRGKPDSVQLDATQQMLDIPLSRDLVVSDGVDYRNYGMLDGIPAMKRFFSELFSIDEKKIFVGGNSSLQLMYDTLMRCMVFGTVGSPRPWCMEPDRKWICITPGYDRHFWMTEKLGFELLSVPMCSDGPDMDAVEALVKDPTVKGIWCVPKYSNPTGNTYSDEVVRRLAAMECAAPDFRIIWDNAYAIHDFDGNGDSLLNIFDECQRYGNENRVFFFSSTSKVTFPGAGVAMMAMSEENLSQTKPILSVSTIGYDKLNQLRHIAFLKDTESTRAHMQTLGKMIKEKFEIALGILDRELSGTGVARYTRPRGGYFISLDVLPGTAKRVFELMRRAGVTLTGVGATFPYGIDPEDKNLRLAPTYPSKEDLALSCEVLCIAIRLAAIEHILGIETVI